MGIQRVLTDLVRGAINESLDLVSIAVGDHQGLPLVSVTRGEVPAMTFTAMATMSLQAAKTATNAIGLEDPEYMVVHSPGGELLVMQVRSAHACLIALLRPDGNLGFAIRTIRRLSEQVGQALAEE
jgi:predicted regulator of Ras-like GTPase activity (Roadblock/LC7/MglB family)